MAKFGAYEILHELKSGGMGSVLLGRKKGPGAFEQLVAIKTIRPEYARTEAVRAMFLDEAKILGGLTHPNIATVHDFGEEGGTLYMVMEYVAGVSFRSLFELEPPPGVAARAIAEACRGLHAAHEVRDISGQLQNVVHRDISPDNLLLGFDGHVKVIDFGIALVKNRQAPVTEFGTVKGKPPYMSPEQVKNESLDRRSDVFSLAVVLYELLTGEQLFDGDSIYAVALAVEQKDIAPPSQLIGRALPIGLDATVMNALDRDLDHRTPTAAAFAEQLEAVIAGSGDETLEAWSERTLAKLRDDHRAWLANVVGGIDQPAPIGRPTGSVTALGPLAFVDKLPDLPAAEADAATPMPSSRRGLALVLAILLLAAGGLAVYLLTRPRSTPVIPADAITTPDAGRDADVVAEIPADTPSVDAAPAPVDAPPPVPDATTAPRDARTVIVRDAGHRPRDARVAIVPDAPVLDAAPPTYGFLTVKHHPSSPTYLEVVVDDRTFGKTPIVVAKKLRTGRHKIALVRPDGDHAVVYQTEVTIVEGQTTAVVQPAP